jgi:hypothetical protein
MMAAPQSTRKLQIGIETTSGTIAAATTLWRGPVNTFKDTRDIKRAPENIGILVPTNRTYTAFLGGELDLPDQVATFEQLPYIFASGIKNVAAGVADGAGTGKVYAYPFPTSSTKNTIKTLTLEAGDAQQAEVGEFGHVSEFKLSGSGKDMVKVGAKWMVRQVANQAFTAALTAPIVEAIPFGKSKLYIDDSGGTLGSTQKTKTFVDFALTCKTGWKPLPTGGDGNLYFVDIDFSDPSVDLDLTFIHDATAMSAKAKWRAETAALIRMVFEGSALTTAGTFSKKTLQLDIAGTWDSFDVLAEKDGFEICKGKLTGGLDVAGALFFAATVVNQQAAL